MEMITNKGLVEIDETKPVQIGDYTVLLGKVWRVEAWCPDTEQFRLKCKIECVVRYEKGDVLHPIINPISFII